MRGQRFSEPSLQPLLKKYNKTAAQILIRWSLQKVFLIFPIFPSPFHPSNFPPCQICPILTHLNQKPPNPDYFRDSSPFPNPSRTPASARMPTCSISPSRQTRSPPWRPRNIPRAPGIRLRVVIDGKENGGGWGGSEGESDWWCVYEMGRRVFYRQIPNISVLV